MGWVQEERREERSGEKVRGGGATGVRGGEMTGGKGRKGGRERRMCFWDGQGSEMLQ